MHFAHFPNPDREFSYLVQPGILLILAVALLVRREK